MLTILREEAAKAGLDLRLEILDSTVGFKKAREKQHDITFMAFGTLLKSIRASGKTITPTTPGTAPFLRMAVSTRQRKIKTQTNNLESFAVLEMDQLIDRYKASSDRRK